MANTKVLGECDMNEMVCASIFKDTICKHYHGDYGMLYSTSTDSGLTIWQCACGHRVVTNQVINDFVLKKLIDEYLQSLKVECKDSPNRRHYFIIDDLEDTFDMYCQWCYDYKVL